MTKKSFRSFFYTSLRIFWSIYFVITIAMVGVVSAYLFAVVLFSLSFITKKLPTVSKFFQYSAEYIQCFAIRFLLTIQPWFICKHGFRRIYGFFNHYETRKVMFVCNHRSNLDTFVMISLVPGLRGLAKKSLFYNLFFAPIMFISGFIPAEKGNLNSYYKGLRRLKTDILDRNRPVLVFPETTRSEKNFPSIGKFSVAIFEIAIESQCLIVPVYIQGTDQLMGRGDLFLNPYQPIELKSLPSIHTNQFNSAAELSKYVWNQLADEQKSREPLCS